MKLSEGYSLRKLHDAYYILPYGQHVASHKKCIRLNETSAFLLNSLLEGVEREDLPSLLMSHLSTTIDQLTNLKDDVNHFIDQMIAFQIIADTPRLPCYRYYLRIAGLCIGYYGPEQLLKSSLLDFAVEEGSVDQYWIIENSPGYDLPSGKILIKTKDIEILQTKDAYILTWYFESETIKALLPLDGEMVRFYCHPPYSNTLTENLFHAFRAVFLFCAQNHNIYAIHSVSILHNNYAWLFSAPSGTGKSTHAELWKALYNTSILNGDLNLVSIQNSVPVVHGLPWCGTSETYTINSYPLGGISFLRQADSNYINILDTADKHLMVMQRLITPSWTLEMLDQNLSFSGALADILPMVCLFCTKEPEAAILMKEYCDKTLRIPI